MEFRFAAPESIVNMNLQWYDPRKAPFSIYGLYKPTEGDWYCRCPEAVAKATNETVAFLFRDTAGGRIRFTTDSDVIAVHVEWPGLQYSDNCAVTGHSNFDLYEDDSVTGPRFLGTFRVDHDLRSAEIDRGYDCALPTRGGKKSYILHFPNYNHVDNVYIGLKEGSFVGKGNAYLPIKPVLYYGSSITQGGCAAHAGNAYENVISRTLNVDHINLGFSGAGRGEAAIVNYMTTIDCSCFVSDYDHNAPTAEHLDRTLRRMFGTFRDKKPELPIILVSRPNFNPDWEDDIRRREIIRSVYEEAVAAGDKNVRYIDGQTLFPEKYYFDCTMEGCHPNDLGFMGMAERIGAAVRDVLGL